MSDHNNHIKQSFAVRLLRTFCPPHLLEEIEGDLMQRYERDLKSSDHSQWSDDYKTRRVKRKFVWNVIRYFRPGILMRNRYSVGFIQAIMLLNYFKTILRHTTKTKLNSFFKLGGLTLAILSLLIISIYVSYQFSFDRFHDQYENIYRVNSQRKENGQIEKFAMAPSAMGPMLQQAFPEVQSYVRIQYPNGNYIRYENKLKSAEGLIEADSSLFNVFTFKFLKGNKAAFNKLNSIVLTKTLAESIFGSTDVLQKIVSINNYEQLYEVSAIIEDVPANSHLYFSAIIPFLEKENFTLSSITSPGEFIEHSSILYLRFREPLADEFTFKVEQLLDHYVKKSDREENEFAISFQPLKNIYLGPGLKYDLRRGSAIYVYTFSIFGFLLLIVAGINYTNLCIADYNSGLEKQESGKC